MAVALMRYRPAKRLIPWEFGDFDRASYEKLIWRHELGAVVETQLAFFVKLCFRGSVFAPRGLPL